MSEKEKMLSGMNYSALDELLLKELNDLKMKIHQYNIIPPADTQQRKALLKSLLGFTGDDDLIINQPFYCDYGKQISIGKRFYAHFNLTILDEAFVTIGAGSVVTKDIPDNVVAVGNSCKILRVIESSGTII